MAGAAVATAVDVLPRGAYLTDGTKLVRILSRTAQGVRVEDCREPWVDYFLTVADIPAWRRVVPNGDA